MESARQIEALTQRLKDMDSKAQIGNTRVSKLESDLQAEKSKICRHIFKIQRTRRSNYDERPADAGHEA